MNKQQKKGVTYRLLLIGAILIINVINGCSKDRGREQATEMNRTNMMIKEKSPYLLQHAHDPVNWYPWGEEAFDKAKKEDKPVFLSIGYSTCHWCHVMKHESFSDPVTAKIMNKNFVSIKVDREERPDVDSIYMTAVLLLTGRGGWPLSVFLTPDGKPFYGGTYFPPEDRWGMPGFKTVLNSIADAWKMDKIKVLASGDSLANLIRRQVEGAGTGGPELTPATLDTAFNQLSSQFDSRHGGFGTAPKFPMGHTLSFLLRYWKRAGSKKSLEMVEKTLDAMASGGMYDQLGGGFHRYSTDRSWIVPHFEKMLYDQAMLSRAYLDAYQGTRKEEYARVAKEILDYVLRDMTAPEGGFYSAEDADSLTPDAPASGIKREGAYYIWSKDRILDLLGKENGELFCYAYGVKDKGNAPDDPHGEFEGKNILHRAHGAEGAEARFEKSPEEVRKILDDSRAKLFAARSKRPRPHLDDKILTDWNGLMIGILARASRVLSNKRYLEAAEKAADFILTKLRREDGRLLHRYRKGDAAIPAYLDDYAFLINGLIELYQASFEPRYLEEAENLSDSMVSLFGEGEEGGLFSTGNDTVAILARERDSHDGAIPSGNSIAALDLLRVGRITAQPSLEARGRAIMDAFSGKINQTPTAHTQMLTALDFAIGPTKEIVIAGEGDDPDVLKMAQFIDSIFMPNKVVVLHGSGKGAKAIEALVPYLKEMTPIKGKATAYVCESYSCKLPTTSLEGLDELLSGNPGRGGIEGNARKQ